MNLTEYEKAAVLLIALGHEHAQPILDRLSAGDLLPIIKAMKKMRKVPPDVRRAVLNEVNDLIDKSANQISDNDDPSTSETTPKDPSILDHIGPYLTNQLDPDQIDWDGAGFNFSDPSDEDPPYEPPEGHR